MRTAVTHLLRAGLLLACAMASFGSLEAAQATNPSELAAASSLDSETGVDQRQLLGEPEGQPISGETLDDLTELVASKMRCPVCQGLSVADSRTVSALAMKGEIRDFLELGYSGEQVLSYFERSYGEFIRLEPKAEGFNLLVWILPLVLVGAGGLLVSARMKPATRDGRSTDSELDAYRERVRDELAQSEVSSNRSLIDER